MTTIPPHPSREAALALLRAVAARAARDECAGILIAWERSGTTADHDGLVLERATRDLDRRTGAGDRTLRNRQQLTEQLENALASRVVIEQAKGILAAEGAVTVDEAFDRLRRHARRHRTSVHEVARAVVEGHLHLTPASPPPAPR